MVAGWLPLLNYKYRTGIYTLLLLLALLVVCGVVAYRLVSRPGKLPPRGARLVKSLPDRASAYTWTPGWHATGGAGGSGRKSSG